MSTIVFLSVIGAAVLHAVWNAFVKGGQDKHLSMGAVVLGHTPISLGLLFFVPLPGWESAPYILAGLGLHAGYQLSLLNSYRHGDFTQVYPIARGSAPLIVAGVSLLFLGVELTTIEILAILIIAAGIISMSLVRQQDGIRNSKAAVLALTTGCFIAAYSLVDGTGARIAGSALSYYVWLSLGESIICFVYLAITRPQTLRDMPQKAKKEFLVGGNASFIAYAIVTWAFTQAPIALVTALRETSIVFALLIGVFFFKEKLSLAKVFSTMVSLFGAALLKLSKL